MSHCDCMKQINEGLAAHNTRVEQVFILSGNSVGMPWPIATVQVEKGRGKPKAARLLASYCPMCGVKLKPEAE